MSLVTAIMSVKNLGTIMLGVNLQICNVRHQKTARLNSTSLRSDVDAVSPDSRQKEQRVFWNQRENAYRTNGQYQPFESEASACTRIIAVSPEGHFTPTPAAESHS